MSISLTDRDLKPCLLNDNKTVITTVTNYGYLLYTLNMLKSLQPFGLDKKILVVCIDNQSSIILKNKGYHVYCINDSSLQRFAPWNTKGYDKICYLKLELIYRMLSLNKNVLLIDGDIVFLKNPLDDLCTWMDTINDDVYIQNDSQSNSNTTNMCTGYLYIKSNKKMMDAYDCVSEEGKQKYLTCAFDNNDQSYFNTFVKPTCKMNALPLEKYPNGKVFYDNPDIIKHTAVLIHFNWVKGHLKMAKMKEHKMWLLTPEEEL